MHILSSYFHFRVQPQVFVSRSWDYANGDCHDRKNLCVRARARAHVYVCVCEYEITGIRKCGNLRLNEQKDMVAE